MTLSAERVRILVSDFFKLTRMKKLATFLTFGLLSASISQAYDRTSFIPKGSPDKLVTVAAFAGDGVSTIRQNYPSQISSVGSFTLTPGNSFIFGATCVINLSNFVGVGTSVGLSVNNYYYNLTALNQNGQSGTLTSLYSANRFTSLDIPVFLQMNFNISTQVCWRNRFGFYLSRGLGGYTHNTTYRSSTNDLGQSMVTHTIYESDYYNDGDGLLNRLSAFDYGLHLATGLTIFRHYNIGVGLNVGFKNIASNFGVYDTKVRTLSFHAKLGYTF